MHRENKGSGCFSVTVTMLRDIIFIVSLIGDIDKYETKIYYINVHKMEAPYRWRGGYRSHSFLSNFLEESLVTVRFLHYLLE